jgi:hypothetical protein
VPAFYSLTRIKDLLSKGRYLITETALRDAFLMEFDDSDIVDCVVGTVEHRDFYKSMAAKKVAGLMQDVYKLRYRGRPIYFKLQVNRAGDAVVISFKEDESGSG